MRTAVVTGAAKGIGRAVAARLVEDGVHVVAVDVDAVALESVSSELGDRFVPVVGDVGDWDTHERAADAARAAGELRYWVNNAGVDWVGAAHEIDLLRQRCRDRGRRRGARAVPRLSAPGCRRRDLNISIDDVYSRV